MREPLYTQMQAVVRAHPELLQTYRDDFEVHDKRDLAEYAEPGLTLLWLVRDSGSTLFPVGYGKFPGHITNFLDNDIPHRVFRLDVERGVYGEAYGRLQEIRDADAVHLAPLGYGLPDVTGYARAKGYTGKRPVLVRDGFVESHGMVSYEAFLESLCATPGQLLALGGACRA